MVVPNNSIHLYEYYNYVSYFVFYITFSKSYSITVDCISTNSITINIKRFVYDKAAAVAFIII